MAFNEDNNKLVKATSTNTSLLSDVRLIVEQGLQTAYQGVNSVMVKTYWQVGRRIVEEEQQGEKRAEYGKQIITLLAEDLSKSYNRGFTARDLRSYRQFYLSFKDLEIWHSRVPNLRWTHFRTRQCGYEYCNADELRKSVDAIDEVIKSLINENL